MCAENGSVWAKSTSLPLPKAAACGWKQSPRGLSLAHYGSGCPWLRQQRCPRLRGPGCLELLLLRTEIAAHSGRLCHLRNASAYLCSPARRLTGKFSIPPELCVGGIPITMRILGLCESDRSSSTGPALSEHFIHYTCALIWEVCPLQQAMVWGLPRC